MNDFLKKLNVLIQAGINDVLEESQKAVSSPRKLIDRQWLGKDIDNEVGYLRGQINKALDYEDELQSRIRDLEQEMTELDQQADAALERDETDQARYLVERMQRAQQRLTMTEADLNEHRIATQELIMRVNELDATISEARHSESQSVAKPQQEGSVGLAEEALASASLQKAQELSQQAGKVLSDVLKEARQKINEMGDMVEAQQEVQNQSTAEEKAADEAAKTAVDEDIANRLARLSKPPKSND